MITTVGELFMSINKKDIIQLLEKIALYLELKGKNPFKISAYRRAAQALERDERSVAQIEDFATIKGIGKGTNAIIVEYIETGKSQTLSELENEIPRSLLPLLHLPGLGGKRIAKLYQELGVKDVLSLKEKCENGEVENLAGFGKKTAENILHALEEAKNKPERYPIAFILPIAKNIEEYLDTIVEVEKYSRAGSLRRMKETIKDIDFIIATKQPIKVRDALLKMINIKDIIAQGETKVSITIEDVYDVNVDFRIVTMEEFASTLHHFTGSKEHNVALRQLAKKQGEKINEYGIEKEDSEKLLTFKTEKALFKHFGLHEIPPEVRENKGELEAFKHNITLINEEDIRGDLHMHTTWSDGSQSIEEMVIHARKQGYEYIAITDHSKFLQVANGLNETRLRRQREEIFTLNEKYNDIHIFSGVEMDILPNGKLDFSTDFLRELDFVIGAIHSGFNQPQEQIMARLYNALENPFISLIAHPTGRLIGRREGYKVDVEGVISKAKETNTALEINANPNRFDLSSEWAKMAQDEGVILAINTDAHSYQTFDHMKYGVSVAKKGWIEKASVMNTWSKNKLIKFFNRNK